MIVTLLTARDGSEGIPYKNTAMIAGMPLYMHNMRAAQGVAAIERHFMSTDIRSALDDAEKYGYEAIKRPESMAGGGDCHTAALQHGVFEIERRIGKRATIVVFLPGNFIGTTSEDIKRSIEILENNPEVDSVCGCSTRHGCPPQKSLVIDGRGYLVNHPQAIVRPTTSMNRNASGETIYLNGSFFTVRRDSLIREDGLMPFRCLGKNVVGLEMNPMYMEIDEPWQLDMMRMIFENEK